MSSRISSKLTPVNDFFICLFVEGENGGENCFTELIICLNKCPLSGVSPHFPLNGAGCSVPHRQADRQQCAKPQNQVFMGSRADKLSDRQVDKPVQEKQWCFQAF